MRLGAIVQRRHIANSIPLRCLGALSAGGLLTLAFPSFDLAFVAWFAIAPLLATSFRVRPGAGFLIGLAFGLGFFGTLLSWISLVGWLAWGVLVFVQALYAGLFGLSWALASRLEQRWLRIAAAAALWVALEFLRANFPVGGFSWGQLAQGQASYVWLLRPASLGGGWLVSFIAVAVNASLYEAWRALHSGRARATAAPLAVAAGLLVAPLAVPANDATGRALNVAIVQGNVPRHWTGSFYGKELAILSSHRHLTSELAPQQPDLVVWPESSVGIDAERDPNAALAIKRSAQAVNAPMIVGGNLDAGRDRYKVMVFHVSAGGEIVDRYQKIHLVPFGEYVPARGLLGWIPALEQVPRDAVRAAEPRTFDIAGGEVAPVISFEGDFGSLVRRPIARGGRLLVVATNTSTWGESAASEQHVAFSRVRAAETGVWVIHGALSGVSAFISPEGSIESRTGLWTAETLVSDVAFAEDTTFYVAAGDWVPGLALVFSALAVALGARRLRAPAGPPGAHDAAPGAGPGGNGVGRP